MSHDPVEDLRKEIAKGRVLAIVGAGVSMGATKNAPTASWTGLLENGVDRCLAVAQPLPKGWEKRVLAEIRSGDMDDLLSAAEKISRKLGFPDGGNYRTWLRDAVGTLRAEDRPVLEALRDLGIPLATTNYDGLLEEVTGLPAVTWREGAKVERVIRGDEKAILHLHGCWDKPESVILGGSSYEGIRRDAHAQNILRTLRTVQTLLFIGCGEGLSDPNMGGLLQWSREVFAGSEYSHYRLCRASEAPDLHKRHPKEERIIVLPYGPDHTDLAPFLRSLRPTAIPEPEKKREREPTPERRAPRLPPLPRCFGRTEQVEDLVATLCTDPPPPTPILGPPGIGKSTITLAALHDRRVIEKYGARRYFVRCDGTKNRDALVGEIITVLGIEPGSNLEERLLLDLESAPTVLTLDNAETPWEADIAAVEDFFTQLTAIPGFALVVSLRGEQRPFGPTWREAIRVAPLDLESARTTFLVVAGERYQNDLDLNQLLEAVDRLPLAVTLLAYQAEGLSDLSGLWKLWQEKRIALLRRADGKERLTNLEVSLELSIQGPRMTEPARRLLSLLGVLPDGIASEDLNAVLPEEGESAAAILRKVGLAIAGDTRLTVLAPVREHVGNQRPPQPEDLSHVINHYLNLAELGKRAGRKGGAEAIERLTLETGNLETMVLQGLETADPIPAIRAARALGNFYSVTGLGTTNLLKRAQDVARQIANEELEAACLEKLGDITLYRSDPDDAREKFQEALPHYQRVGDLLGQANCIQSLGDIALRRSDHDNAREKFQEALALYEKIHEPYSIGWARVRLARIAPTPEERLPNVETAREAWTRIKRPDLVEELDKEFGSENS
ncbi:MAG TPA: SIR2 family protein [Thermoanaerobaculia bacterium]|nr:SIR2 family protein [Thermoanaerobaculia bacterium]